VALAEAALHSGVGARLDLPLDALTLFGEGRGQAILAVLAHQVETDPLGSDIEIRRIGEVGGDEILGVSLDRLRAVWEPNA
jgi:phosphoribosylformylglycinamidine (FGAM) synthase-like enzyme